MLQLKCATTAPAFLAGRSTGLAGGTARPTRWPTWSTRRSFGPTGGAAGPPRWPAWSTGRSLWSTRRSFGPTGRSFGATTYGSSSGGCVGSSWLDAGPCSEPQFGQKLAASSGSSEPQFKQKLGASSGSSEPQFGQKLAALSGSSEPQFGQSRSSWVRSSVTAVSLPLVPTYPRTLGYHLSLLPECLSSPKWVISGLKG